MKNNFADGLLRSFFFICVFTNLFESRPVFADLLNDLGNFFKRYDSNGSLFYDYKSHEFVITTSVQNILGNPKMLTGRGNSLEEALQKIDPLGLRGKGPSPYWHKVKNVLKDDGQLAELIRTYGYQFYVTSALPPKSERPDEGLADELNERWMQLDVERLQHDRSTLFQAKETAPTFEHAYTKLYHTNAQFASELNERKRPPRTTVVKNSFRNGDRFAIPSVHEPLCMKHITNEVISSAISNGLNSALDVGYWLKERWF